MTEDAQDENVYENDRLRQEGEVMRREEEMKKGVH
jgi:hypothetical protein